MPLGHPEAFSLGETERPNRPDHLVDGHGVGDRSFVPGVLDTFAVALDLGRHEVASMADRPLGGGTEPPGGVLVDGVT